MNQNHIRKGFEKVPHSYGYSSTGVIYDSFGHVKSSTRQIYGGGDVIRCYVDKRKLAIYFSKNMPTHMYGSETRLFHFIISILSLPIIRATLETTVSVCVFGNLANITCS